MKVVLLPDLCRFFKAGVDLDYFGGTLDKKKLTNRTKSNIVYKGVTNPHTPVLKRNKTSLGDR